MGLGKTVQTTAFLALLKRHFLASRGVAAGAAPPTPPPGPHLVIVPASTLDNWAAELRRFAPELNVIVYYGAAAERKALRERHLVKASPRTGGRSGRRKHKRGWWEAGHARPSTLHEGWYWTQPTPAMPWARVTV